MAVFTRVKTWVSNEVLTASDLNGEFNNIINNMKPEGIEDYSPDVATMQSTTDPGGLGTESLATTEAGELQRLRYVIKRIGGVAYWYVAPSRNLGTGALAVQTADVADGAITNAKIGARGQQISNSSSTFFSSSTSEVDITNLSKSYTSVGRPVVVKFIPDGLSASGIELSRNNNFMSATIRLYRDATLVASIPFSVTSSGAASVLLGTSVSSVEGFDVVAAGTYTYKATIQCAVSTNSAEARVLGAKLCVYEI